jgi:hypothetical protein
MTTVDQMNVDYLTIAEDVRFAPIHVNVDHVNIDYLNTKKDVGLFLVINVGYDKGRTDER